MTLNRFQLLFLSLMVLLNQSLFAFPEEGKTPEKIHFVYLHGANYNTIERKNLFFSDVPILHQLIKHNFEHNAVIQKHLLKSGQVQIAAEPIPFYWGNKSHTEISYVNNHIELTGEGHLPSITQAARKLIAHVLHDAAWFEREYNKEALLDNLFDTVQQQVKDNGDLVILGHSAGSLITYEFMTRRIAYLEPLALLNEMGVETQELTSSQPPAALPQTTCISALIASDMIHMGNNGLFIPSESIIEPTAPGVPFYKPNGPVLRQKLDQLQAETAKSCLPIDRVKGFVTFGSPLPVFSSSIGASYCLESFFAKQLLSFIRDNNMFWIHINHADDPIALAIPEDKIKSEVRNDDQHVGFITNYMKRHRGANIIQAHEWYWRNPAEFASILTKAYEEGDLRWNPAATP